MSRHGGPVLWDRGPVWAIDPATMTGFARGVPGGTPELRTLDFRVHKEDPVDLLFHRAARWIVFNLRDDKPALIVIESPIPETQMRRVGSDGVMRGGTNWQTTQLALGLQGLFAGLAGCKGVPLAHAHIATWRKFFLGYGNLPGKEAKRRALDKCRALGWHAPDHNAAEAAGMWLWGCHQVAPRLAQNVTPLFAAGRQRA